MQQYQFSGPGNRELNIFDEGWVATFVLTNTYITLHLKSDPRTHYFPVKDLLASTPLSYLPVNQPDNPNYDPENPTLDTCEISFEQDRGDYGLTIYIDYPKSPSLTVSHQLYLEQSTYSVLVYWLEGYTK